jgi:hypothetical protein
MSDSGDVEGDAGPHADGSLVFPFLCVQSKNGPFDDRAFVAGAQLGQILEALRSRNVSRLEAYIFPEIAETVDLAAMRYGWVIKSCDPWGDNPEEWSRLEMIKVKAKT